MRWDRLFEDLAAQLDAAQRDDLDAEVMDRTRREVALVHMADRLAAATGRAVQLNVPGTAPLSGSISRVGAGWLLLASDTGDDLLVPLAAVLSASGLGSPAAAPDRLEAVIDIGHALRVIARDRAPVVIGLTDGSRLEGTIDRVGADFIDVAIHPLDEPRRPAQVTSVRTVSLSGLGFVRAR